MSREVRGVGVRVVGADAPAHPFEGSCVLDVLCDERRRDDPELHGQYDHQEQAPVERSLIALAKRFHQAADVYTTARQRAALLGRPGEPAHQQNAHADQRDQEPRHQRHDLSPFTSSPTASPRDPIVGLARLFADAYPGGGWMKPAGAVPPRSKQPSCESSPMHSRPVGTRRESLAGLLCAQADSAYRLGLLDLSLPVACRIRVLPAERVDGGRTDPSRCDDSPGSPLACRFGCLDPALKLLADSTPKVAAIGGLCGADAERPDRERRRAANAALEEAGLRPRSW